MDKIVGMLKELILVMQFLVPGCVFLAVKDFVACTDRDENSTHYLVSCAAISYFFNLLTQSFSLPCLGELASELLYAACGGLILGLLLRSQWMENILKNWFKRGVTSNLSVSLLQFPANQAVLVQLTLKGQTGTLFGNLIEVLDPYASPILIVRGYCFFDSNGNPMQHRDYRGSDYRIAVTYADCSSFEYCVIPLEESAANAVNND